MLSTSAGQIVPIHRLGQHYAKNQQNKKMRSKIFGIIYEIIYEINFSCFFGGAKAGRKFGGGKKLGCKKIGYALYIMHDPRKTFRYLHLWLGCENSAPVI